MTLLPAGTYGLTVRRDGIETYQPAGLVLRGRKVRVKVAVVHVAPAAGPEVAVGAVEFTDSMTAPEMLSGQNPEYTSQAVEHGVEGPMMVHCVVTVEGKVRACKVLKGLPFMNQPVLDALERRKYRPALAQGRPVGVFYTFNLRLRLPQ